MLAETVDNLFDSSEETIFPTAQFERWWRRTMPDWPAELVIVIASLIERNQKA